MTGANVPLITLIRNVYTLQPVQLVNAPDWIETARFDIEAKADREYSAREDALAPELLAMMRNLLADRFSLVVHREMRDMSVYAIVMARSDGSLGPQMRRSTVDCEGEAARAFAARRSGGATGGKPIVRCRISTGAGRIQGTGPTHITFGEIAIGRQPLTELVFALVPIVGRTAVDKTGLTGNYDLLVKFTPDRILQRAAGTNANAPIRVNGTEIDPNGPSIFTALQEQLGLKLESERGTVDVLVIDHIERPSPDYQGFLVLSYSRAFDLRQLSY